MNDKRWSIHIVDYYLATKRNEVLMHTTTWIDPENMMLS